MKNKISLLLARSADALLALFWGFCVLFVTSRLYTGDDLARILVLVAFINSVMLLELGVGASIYASMRREMVVGGGDRDVIKRYLFFLLVFLIVSILFLSCIGGLALLVFDDVSTFYIMGLASYVTFSLPWSVLGAAVRAHGEYTRFYFSEATRKFISLVGLVGLQTGIVDFFGFFCLVIISWLAAACIVICHVKSAFFQILSGSVFVEIKRKFHQSIINSSAFSLVNYLNMQSPYLLIFYVFNSAEGVVLFDVFNKLRRGANILIAVLIDIASPKLTRAFHLNTRHCFRYQLFRISVAGAVVIIMFSFSIMFTGVRFLEFLVSGFYFEDKVLLVLSLSIAAFGFNSIAGTILSHVGKFRILLKLSLLEISMAFLFCLIVFYTTGSYLTWFGSYALVISATALLKVRYLHSLAEAPLIR